jgi:hypothetical protein
MIVGLVEFNCGKHPGIMGEKTLLFGPFGVDRAYPFDIMIPAGPDQNLRHFLLPEYRPFLSALKCQCA